jgi:cyclophilin family peptidyl-prolyl cis-trans isomerase
MRGLLLVLVLGGSWACGRGDDGAQAREPASGQPAARAEQPRSTGPTREELIALADARPPMGGALRDAATSERAETRAHAMTLLARQHDPTLSDVLIRGLGDPSPAVRDAASLGLGALEDQAPESVGPALLGAVAAEASPELRAAFLFDLGRVGDLRSIAALDAALEDPAAEVRRGACRGLANYGIRGRNLDRPVLERIARRASSDEATDVRRACAFALSRIPPLTSDAGEVIGSLRQAASVDDAPTRGFALRALAKYDVPIDVFADRTDDPDWQVAVQAFRSLAQRVESRPAPYALALRRRLDRALGLGPDLTGPELHVLTTALHVKRAVADDAAVHGVANEALERLGQMPDGAPLSRDRGLAHCEAARLVDLGRGWPARVDSCGLEQVTDVERKVMAAEIVGEVQGDDPQRARYLVRLFEAGPARVQQAAIDACGSVRDPAADQLVLRALASGDPGVIVEAAEALELLLPVWRTASEEPASFASVRPAGTPMPEPQRPRGAGPRPPEIHRALAAALEALRRQDDLEGLQAWLKAMRAADDRAFEGPVRELAAHPNATLRAAAREAATHFGWTVPEGHRPVPNAIAEAALGALPARAVLVTQRGDVEVELLSDHAPTTVARFAGLAREGFYDGLTLHRVVPAFVIQGGDPRGDGYGGPGWSQRCEDNRVAYERGTVGMALAGRDTGGSQFFIAHGPAPHLDARYTAFGRVVRGMEVVDRIQVGDTITAVRLVPRETEP